MDSLVERNEIALACSGYGQVERYDRAFGEMTGTYITKKYGLSE